MGWSWLIPLNVVLLVVPAMFGVWAWMEVVERIHEQHAAVGRRTRLLRLALVATSATFLVGAGTWIHPVTIESTLAASMQQRLLLYALVAVPWTAFGIIGLLARNGRRTGVRGFLQERTRHAHHIGDVQDRSRAFLHAVGVELEEALRHLPVRLSPPDDAATVDGTHVARHPARAHDPADRLRHLAHALQNPSPTEPTDVALDDCLADRLQAVRPLAEERGVAVFRAGLEDVHVHVGPKRLRQVLQVILEGALERAPRVDGLVVVTIREKPQTDQIQLTVSDNGRALTDADLARAFALDTEIRPGTRPIPGLGFPLAVARRLARQDGGDLHIAPATGGGTVLALLLPRHIDMTRHEDPAYGH